jgi:DDE superfamily endonuclease
VAERARPFGPFGQVRVAESACHRDPIATGRASIIRELEWLNVPVLSILSFQSFQSKHPNVKAWLNRHKRFHLHFIPTSSSWLNLVERWFREITDKRIRRGVFQSVDRLIEAIRAYIDEHNENPKPFVWTAKAEDILEKVRRAWAVMDKIASE